MTYQIIGAARDVHKVLRPGLLESAHEESLCHELHLRGIPFGRQVEMPILYKGIRLAVGYRMDLALDRKVVVELEAVNCLEPMHEAQLLTYLRLSGLKIGLLINFNVPVFKGGIKRLVL